MARLDLDPSLIKQVSPYTYEIPIGFVPNMRVPGLFYATDALADHALAELREWMGNRATGLPSILQVAFVATLPGIRTASFGMPDMHSGYGFSIGAVAAFATADPACVISPGGVGYDINCGVRLLTTNLTRPDISSKVTELVNCLYKNVPVGVGGKRKNFIKRNDLLEIGAHGAKWALTRGYAVPSDIENCEGRGCMATASVDCVSERALQRGVDQLGTLGSGNHFLELQVVEEVFDAAAAAAMGLHREQIVVMIHTGSRGFGYQIAEDFVREVEGASDLPDRQLAAAPLASEVGRRYFGAMGAAANFAWCNRQVITHFTRSAFRETLDRADVQLDLVYDVAHNIAKIETHDGVEVIVHRKGATRALPPGSAELPERYRAVGQPVLVGGSMGSASYVLAGAEGNPAFASTCHGAGRALSRSRACKTLSAEATQRELEEKGIAFRAASQRTVVEEAPETYKDVEQVVEACDAVCLSRRVARLIPVGVIKG
jgi:tRNA-splicing ligase RtcB